mgnify:CR=1 FL=1
MSTTPADTLNAVLLPLRDERLLLPNLAIAEVIETGGSRSCGEQPFDRFRERRSAC